MSATPAEAPFAGVVIEVVSETAGMAIVVTGLAAAALRALAVLGESSHERVEWLTSFGFVIGIVLSVLLLAFDLVFG
jgi:hypothetical protein